MADPVIHEIFVDPGDTVLCDFCNGDWTNRPESGGFLFSSYGTCPDCAAEMERSAIELGEAKYILARCPPDMSFADWIRDVIRRW